MLTRKTVAVLLGVLAVFLCLLVFSGFVVVPRSQLPALIDQTSGGDPAPVRMMSVEQDLRAKVNSSRVTSQGELPLRDVVDNSGAVKFLQHYAKLFNKGQMSFVQPNLPSSVSTWWQAAAMIDWYINTPIRHKCNAITNMGNWHVCQEGRYLVKPPCLVYSFGINWDFSFDDAMGKLGCEVHSFDPSMNTSSHRRSANVMFHNIGLGNFNSDAFDPRQDMYVKDNQKWRMRTLKSVVEMLGHENRVIDVLKIDIEGHEWAVVENLIETGMFPFVRQFMLEWHLFPTWPVKEEYVHLYQVFTKLREMGFREFRTGPHPKTLDLDKFNNQGDNEYVNLFFEKKPHWT